MADTIVWITGATGGLGEALARSVPWPDARVVNLSRSAAPGLENLRFDLTAFDSGYPPTAAARDAATGLR